MRSRPPSAPSSTRVSARVIAYDSACAAGYAAVRTSRELAGRPVKIPDLQIAGTALAHGAAVATRNVPDFEDCGVTVLNPWEHRT